MSPTHWILTSSGKRFYYDGLVPEQFDIEDMAAGISRTCRYNGQLKNGPECEDEIYTVAQHSVYVYRFLRDHVPNCPQEALAWALLHDGIEGYYSDLPSPLKGLSPEYKAQENAAELVFRSAFEIPFSDVIHDYVKYSDINILWAETQEMCAIPAELWDTPSVPDITLRNLDPDFYYWRPKKAREEFMDSFEKIKHLLGAI